MRKIRVVHYGIGHDHSNQFMECLKSYPDLYEIVGICEPNEEMRKKFGDLEAYKGLRWLTEEEMFALTDVDAAIVEAYDLDLVKYAQKCADKGWHIHMDKAAGADIKAYKKLLDTVRAKNLVFQTGYMFRYNPFVRRALDALRSGELGEIYHIDAFMNTCFLPEKREWLSKLPGGDMLYLGCHMLDLVYLFWGVPNRIVRFNKNTGADGIDCVDNGCVVLEYDKGVALVRASALEVNGCGRRQFVVCGKDATYELNTIEGPPKARITKRSEARTYGNWAKESVLGDFTNAMRYEEMMCDFAAYVRGEKQNPFTLQYEYQVHKIILTACGQDLDYKSLD